MSICQITRDNNNRTQKNAIIQQDLQFNSPGIQNCLILISDIAESLIALGEIMLIFIQTGLRDTIELFIKCMSIY